MKNIEDILMLRTSIRRYTREKLSEEQLDYIYRAISNTPTSYNGQQFSVISVTDQEKKEKLYEITGQKQIKTSAVFMAFCADFHKIKVAAQAKGVDFPLFTETLDGVMVGMIDASLAMQNAAIAAYSLGLGCCFIGYARTAHPEKIAELLNLPDGVFVVCGLTIGYPAETPDLKPKQPLSLLIHENGYREDNMTEKLLKYDETISDYNRSRSGTTTDNDWIEHMLCYYREALKYDMEGYLRKQGFKLPFESR